MTVDTAVVNPRTTEKRRIILRALPACLSGLLGDLCPSLRVHGRGPRRAALSTHGGCGRVFAFIRIALLNFARSDIDNELGELRGIARALRALSRGHVAGRGSAALVIPSANRPDFHLGVVRRLLCLVAHVPNMARLPSPFHG